MAEQHQTTTSRSPFTWMAIATVTPITHTGSVEDCEAWMQAIGGCEITVTDKNGVTHVIGVVTHLRSEALDA